MIKNLVIFSVIFILSILILNHCAEAHSWYSYACCGGQDCHPIKDCSELVSDGHGGYFWQGNHFLASMIHPSQDAHCHVCVSDYTALGGTKTPHCAYIQLGE